MFCDEKANSVIGLPPTRGAIPSKHERVAARFAAGAPRPGSGLSTRHRRSAGERTALPACGPESTSLARTRDLCRHQGPARASARHASSRQRGRCGLCSGNR